jgi:serine/threonine-protein kinase HipA
MKCAGCYKDTKEGYCLSCRKKLFGGIKISATLSFDAPKENNLESFQEHSKRLSISGVQLKYSLKLENKTLQLCETGAEYILKPISFARQLVHLESTPENEHLTMQKASQIFGISTAANGLIFFKDGQPAYITRRFDVGPGGKKYLQEDFAQLTNRTRDTHGEIFKYEGSYKEIGGLINRFAAAAIPSLEKFFQLVVFNYVISNGDAHLKNFSLFRDETGEYKLTPAYDLLSSVIHSPQESDTALNLYEGDYQSEFYEAYGHYGRSDFLEFARRLGIIEIRAKRILDDFLNKKDQMICMVQNSFLLEEVKTIYINNLEGKIKRLR